MISFHLLEDCTQCSSHHLPHSSRGVSSVSLVCLVSRQTLRFLFKAAKPLFPSIHQPSLRTKHHTCWWQQSNYSDSSLVHTTTTSTMNMQCSAATNSSICRPVKSINEMLACNASYSSFGFPLQPTNGASTAYKDKQCATLTIYPPTLQFAIDTHPHLPSNYR